MKDEPQLLHDLRQMASDINMLARVCRVIMNNLIVADDSNLSQIKLAQEVITPIMDRYKDV